MTRLPAWARWLGAGLFVLALLAFLAYLLIYINFAVALFRFPFDYDQGEGFELYDTLLHAQGEWPYRDSAVFPFYTSIYPPLFHLLTVPLVWLFGPMMWTGRLVSFLASLVAAGGIGYGVWRELRPAEFSVRELRRGFTSGVSIPLAVSLLSGLAFLASNYVYHIGALFRQHMTMVMFETLAIVVLARLDHLRGSRRRTIVWGLLLLLAAGFTKQLALATAIAAFAFLFLRAPRTSLLYGLGFSGVFSVLFGWINLATDGHWFTGIVLANVNEFIAGQAGMLYRQWAELHAVLIAAALARLVYETYASRLSAYSLWFLFAVVNGVTAGKFGAGESYFVTAVAAACILSGIAFGRLWRRASAWGPAARGLIVVAVPLAYFLQARLVLHLPTRGPVFEPVARALGLPLDAPYFDSQGYTQLGRPPDRNDIAAGWRIAGYISRSEKPALSEEAGFPLAVGSQVVSNPFPQLMMHRAGIFDSGEFVRTIEAQEFDVVILRAQFYPPPILEAIGRAYAPETEIRMNGFTYRILLPK